MTAEVRIPEVGESITEGFLAEWLKPDGSMVEVEDPLLVLETDKITMNVNAEQAGRLKILAAEGATVEVGQVVATIDTDVEQTETAAPEPASEADTEAVPAPTETAPEAGRISAPNHSGLSPAVRRLVLEHGLEPSEIEGTGKDSRLLKGDVIRFLEERESDARQLPEKKVERPRPQPVDLPDQRQTRRPMSRLRQRLAERLVEVQQTAAILTTFNEADMSRVMALRAEYKDDFKKRHDIGLGFMSFFVKATVDALKTVPEVNAYIDGDEIVTNHYYDIGVAVSTDKGLVVPVIRTADRLSMAEIESGIADLAKRAQERRLELSDLSGAVFTISNGGVFGSLLSTPILNPPGSAILGMHTIQKRPIAVGDEIAIRPMMYLAVSYDHRLIDGREAVTFLKRIVECIENPERMLLEI
ncbi:MAG: 2-oxoglutarate dehydrogenase complex dihydrolipoyllysine-residue succinyltransferase [Acidobacteria bacterium]|jgi:2-oxoglutarate dehydrogenase E2 component (dihydrolipoamide succinyltransferase)|nr:2-oxoglutarate dehydrogenase complex dihydrolipoyllysine-residue succinyltransferase [Acidobacteriota bacterium]